jgi:hypothetical protein
MEYLLCICWIKIKIWNYVLGWWWKIYSDIPTTKKVIKLITGTHKRTSCRPIFRKLKILTLVSLYIFEMLCFFKKIYKWNLKHNSEIHGHNTRRKQDLHTQQCNTVMYQKSVINRGKKLFNKLPMQIKQLDKYKSFKKEVKTVPRS